MNHLDRPQDADPPIVNVPVLCLDPSNNSLLIEPDGWPCESVSAADPKPVNRTRILEELEQLSWLGALGFIQIWFYFGLLRKVFDSNFVLEEFIVLLNDEVVLDSSRLPYLIAGELQRHKDMSKAASNQVKKRIREWLYYVSDSAEVIEMCIDERYT
jgi:hypothetical protein